MLLRDAIVSLKELSWMMEQMELLSPLGRSVLYEQEFSSDQQVLNKEYEKIEHTIDFVRDDDMKQQRAMVELKLMELRDIRRTVERLGGKAIRTDVELFELKSFSLTVERIVKELGNTTFDVVVFPSLQPVIDLLDPEQKRLPNFYIYDAYSERLTALRKEMRIAREGGEEEEEVERLRIECLKEEDRIRRSLSEKLATYKTQLKEAISSVIDLDMLLAKAKLAEGFHLTKPNFQDSESTFSKIFNPMVAYALTSKKRQFQPVSIVLKDSPVVITGANMAGKSVLLRTLGLVQFLAQFGFFVPAEYAEIVCVDDVELILGDAQDVMQGLSSFGAEMKGLDRVIRRIRSGEKLLVLVDEPARTTNPKEGKAIVSGLLQLLLNASVYSVITTHYAGIEVLCRKMKVKGFVGDQTVRIGVEELNNYIDYSLEEDEDGAVPHEALRIAQILGVDRELLEESQRYLREE